MVDSVTLTFADIANIIIQAQKAGMNGEYVYGIVIQKPYSASQSLNSAIGMEKGSLRSASADEPYPYVRTI